MGSGQVTAIGFRKIGGAPVAFARDSGALAGCGLVKTAVIVGGLTPGFTASTCTVSWFSPTSTTRVVPASILQEMPVPATGRSVVPLSPLSGTVRAGSGAGWARGAGGMIGRAREATHDAMLR